MLRRPQCRSLVHWTSSLTVTNARTGWVPADRAASRWGSRPRKEREATSVSKTTASTDSSAKAGAPGCGHEREELIQLLIGLERVAAQLVNRADRMRAGRPGNQLIQRHQVALTGCLLDCGALTS